jgi:Glycosyl transferase family 2
MAPGSTEGAETEATTSPAAGAGDRYDEATTRMKAGTSLHNMDVSPGTARHDGQTSARAPVATPARSVGIMPYNEAANSASALDATLNQCLMHGHLAEVVVIASGCTDETVPIVAAIARHDTRVRLVVQERREGQASSILILAGAGVVIRARALDALLCHFNDPRVGIVGAHPMPVNDERTFLGRAVGSSGSCTTQWPVSRPSWASWWPSGMWTRAFLMRSRRQPVLTPLGVKVFDRDNRHSIDTVRTERGYFPRVALREGVRLAAAWYQAQTMPPPVHAGRSQTPVYIR